jgi:DNA-binding MarR family transcriptional regulator
MPKQNSILRKQRTPYTTVSNELISDNELYLRDKGLYVFMFSKPEGWSFSVRGLASQVKEGKTSVSKSLKRLIERGWLTRSEIRTDGRYTAYEYEIKAIKGRDTVSRKTDTPSAKPDTGKRTLSNTYSKKEREVDFLSDKKAIDTYIDEVIKSTRNIKNETAYKRELIKKFMSEDQSTLYAFNQWLPEYISRELQSQYYDKEINIKLNNSRNASGHIVGISAGKDGGYIMTVQNNETHRDDRIAFNDLAQLNKILETAQ